MDSKIKYTPSREATWETTDGSIFDRQSIAESHQDGLNKPKWIPWTVSRGHAITHLRRARDGVMNGMSWSHTPEGQDYWSPIYDKLDAKLRELEE